MTKEEYDALPPYEKKSVGIFNEMKEVDDLHHPKVINYFCPVTPDWNTFPKDWVDGYKKGKPDKEVTGTVKKVPETNFDKTIDTRLVIGKIQDKLFTKKKTKDENGRMVRQTLRKGCDKLPPWEAYHLSSLMLYARQAHSEGCNKMILSWQECKFLDI